MNSNKFRKELVKIMPRYKWTIHRKIFSESYKSATGIQTAGFNRLSTLQVVRREKKGEIEYEVKSAGFGKSSPWLSEWKDETLARALRGLQDYYEKMAMTYNKHASFLKYGRTKEA